MATNYFFSNLSRFQTIAAERNVENNYYYVHYSETNTMKGIFRVTTTTTIRF